MTAHSVFSWSRCLMVALVASPLSACGSGRVTTASSTCSATGGTSHGGARGVGGSVATGGQAGTAGAGGSALRGNRYARFLALTSIPNDDLTSMSEFELLDTNGHSLPRSGWKPTVDSEELVDAYCPAEAALDGDLKTFWQTEWGAYVAPLPHTLTLDLGQPEVTTGFIYTPRQDWYNGRIGSWEFYLSNDPNVWGSPVVSGKFPDAMDVQTRTYSAR